MSNVFHILHIDIKINSWLLLRNRLRTVCIKSELCLMVAWHVFGLACFKYQKNWFCVITNALLLILYRHAIVMGLGPMMNYEARQGDHEAMEFITVHMGLFHNFLPYVAAGWKLLLKIVGLNTANFSSVIFISESIKQNCLCMHGQHAQNVLLFDSYFLNFLWFFVHIANFMSWSASSFTTQVGGEI